MFGSDDSSKLKPGVARQATTDVPPAFTNTLANAWMVNQLLDGGIALCSQTRSNISWRWSA